MKLFTEKCSDQKLSDILNKIQRKMKVSFQCLNLEYGKGWSSDLIIVGPFYTVVNTYVINLSKDNMTFFKGGIKW